MMMMFQYKIRYKSSLPDHYACTSGGDDCDDDDDDGDDNDLDGDEDIE